MGLLQEIGKGKLSLAEATKILRAYQTKSRKAKAAPKKTKKRKKMLPAAPAARVDYVALAGAPRKRDARKTVLRALDGGLAFKPRTGQVFDLSNPRTSILASMGLRNEAELRAARDLAKRRAQRGAPRNQRKLEASTDAARIVRDLLGDLL